MGSRCCVTALFLGVLQACAPVDIDVPAHVVLVETTCLGGREVLAFSVPDWDVDVPICLLDPMCREHASSLGDIPHHGGPPGMELTVWGHDERGLEGYTATMDLGIVDGRASFRWCESRDAPLGVPVECEDRDSHGDPIDLFPEPCEATFTMGPADLGG